MSLDESKHPLEKQADRIVMKFFDLEPAQRLVHMDRYLEGLGIEEAKERDVIIKALLGKALAAHAIITWQLLRSEVPAQLTFDAKMFGAPPPPEGQN